MKFTKEPPYSLGQLACVINATIEILEIKINKLSSPSLGDINKTLSSIGFGYQPSFNLGNQWHQLVDMFTKMNIDDNTMAEILKLAETKYEHLKLSKQLT